MRTLPLLLLILLGGLAGCRTAPATVADADAPLRVAVSVPPQAYFVERIGGRRVAVEVMIPPGASDEDYEPTPRQVVALSRARLYVAVGHPAYELERGRLAPFLASLTAKSGLRVVDMSRGMLLAADDPHVWVAPATVAVAARNIAAALAEIDPAHAGEYRANLARFEADVADLDREIRAGLAPVRGGSFLVYHPTWGYFAREYGLRQVAIEAEGREPDARRLMGLIDEARRERVRAIFVQRGFPRRSAQVVADAVGGSLVTADPQERDWLQNLRRVTRELREALSHA